MTVRGEECDADVVIIGYGPVGQLAALLLGRAGHRVTVFERWPSLYRMPRAAHFDYEIARIFQGAGFRADKSSAIEPYDDMYVCRNADRNTLLELDWTGVGPTGWPTANFFNQPMLERELDALVQAQPTVHVERGWQATAVGQDDHGTQITVERVDISDGELELHNTRQRRTVTARYVIGADGVNSLVREAIGARLHDLGYFYDWLIVDVLPDNELTFTPPAWQLCDPTRPTTLVPSGPGRRRWEFMRLPKETIAELNTTGRAWELLAPWDVRPDNATLERHAVYTFQARWAEHWQAGRLFIAGDAAHLMPPFAGQGMCAGLRDVKNLTWKLDRVLRGTSPEALLSTYTSERIPHLRHFIDLSMEIGKVICISDPEKAAERDAVMMATPTDSEPPPKSPRLGMGLLDAESAAAGTLSVQALVRHAGSEEPALLDDVLGGGGCLLLADPSLLKTVQKQPVVDDLSIAELPVVAMGDEARMDVVVDATGAYTAWMVEIAAVAVLIRPDFAVYGTADTAQDIPRLLAAYRAALLESTPNSVSA